MVGGGNIDSYGSPQAGVIGGGGGGGLSQYGGGNTGGGQSQYGGGGGGHGGGGGGSSAIDSYGAPQAGVVGGGNIDSYGSPQAAVIGGGGGGGALSQYGGGSTGGGQSQYGGGGGVGSGGGGQSQYGGGGQAGYGNGGGGVAPASLSNTVIKMLPAPNLATAAPNAAGAGGFAQSAQSSYGAANPFVPPSNAIPPQNSYSSNAQSQNLGGGFQPASIAQPVINPSTLLQTSGGGAPDSYGSPNGSPISSGGAAPAPDSYGQPQTNVISSGGGSSVG